MCGTTREPADDGDRRGPVEPGLPGSAEGQLAASGLTAVDELSFTVEDGEAVGYIGANGAGKSTTIKMITGILVPTSGAVRTCGLDPLQQRRELARHIGVVFGQRTQLWWDLPLRESFEILSAIHRLSPARATQRTAELVDRLDMAATLDTPVRQLSLGQRMRGEVAAALLHSPRLLILDEPTIGLDVLSKLRLREFLIAERAEHGTTLLLTTHDMGDVERLCDRVLVVDTGWLVYDGSLPGLARTVGAQRVLVVDLLDPVLELPPVPGPTAHRRGGGRAAAPAGVRRRGDHRRRRARRAGRQRRGPRPVRRGAADRGRRPADLSEPARRVRLSEEQVLASAQWPK